VTGRLKAAHEALAKISQEMQALEPNKKFKMRAAGLVRRHVQAMQEHAEALARLGAWLTP
jgi:hypothetical protein